MLRYASICDQIAAANLAHLADTKKQKELADKKRQKELADTVARVARYHGYWAEV